MDVTSFLPYTKAMSQNTNNDDQNKILDWTLLALALAGLYVVARSISSLTTGVVVITNPPSGESSGLGKVSVTWHDHKKKLQGKDSWKLIGSTATIGPHVVASLVFVPPGDYDIIFAKTSVSPPDKVKVYKDKTTTVVLRRF